MFDTGIDTAPEAAIALIVLAVRRRRAVQPAHPAHRRAAAAARAQRRRAGARLLELQRAPVERQARPDLAGHDDACSGASRATCASSSSPGPRRRSATRTTQASSLVGVVAIGTAAGAVVASMRMRLDQATSVIPLGIAMGVLVIGLNFITNVWVAAPFLILLGAIGGYLVVPMNALLQHRGANLMGAGRSIAVQNFNEQACILGLGAFYTGMTRFGLSAFVAIAIFGVLVAGTMWLIRRWHTRNCVHHRGRDRAPAGDRAPRQALTAPVAGARRRLAALGAGLQRLRLGHLVVAVPPAAGRRAASALGDGADLHARLAGDRRAAAARGRPGAAHAGALGAGRWPPGTTNAAFNWARVDRRRRPRGAAVLPDAAVDRAARARRCWASASPRAAALRVVLGPGRRGDRALAGGGGGVGGCAAAAAAALARRLARLRRRLLVRAQQRDAAARGGAARGRPGAGDVPRRRAGRRRAGAPRSRASGAVRWPPPASRPAGSGRWPALTRALPRRQPGAAVRRRAAAGEPDRGRDADRGGVRLGVGGRARRRRADRPLAIGGALIVAGAAARRASRPGAERH